MACIYNLCENIPFKLSDYRSFRIVGNGSFL